MYPIVSLSEVFLDHLDSIANKIFSQSRLIIPDNVSENENRSLNRISNLLQNSFLNITISEKRIIPYYKRELGIYSSYKSLIIHNAIKNARLAIQKQDSNFELANCCYFTETVNPDCQLISEQSGLVIIGHPCVEIPFFLEHTFAGIETDDKLTEVDICKHSCSGMIIFDRFLFRDDPNRPPKIPNLVLMLEKFIFPSFTACFELDIIIENSENNTLLKSKFDQILNAFEPGKLSLHVYAPKRLIENDRYFITNYAVITVGHPLDRKTNISCNFYPSQGSSFSLKNAYKIWKNKIELAKKIIQDTPHSLGRINCCIANNEKSHKIFSTRFT